MKKMRNYNVGLIKGRHEIAAVEEYIFNDAIKDVTDIEGLYNHAFERLMPHRNEQINLYVTGLTVACTTVIKVCIDNDINLSLWHFDTQTCTYYEQVINRVEICPFCGRPRGNGWFCKNCGST